MTEWHIRYGGRGVMIYWHVEEKSACIYSQLKRCSSSEVAAMIEGVLRHARMPKSRASMSIAMARALCGQVKAEIRKQLLDPGSGAAVPLDLAGPAAALPASAASASSSSCRSRRRGA